MSPDLLRGFLQIGFFVGMGGLILALLQPPGSPELVVSICSAGIGFTLIFGVVIVSRLFK